MLLSSARIRIAGVRETKDVVRTLCRAGYRVRVLRGGLADMGPFLPRYTPCGRRRGSGGSAQRACADGAAGRTYCAAGWALGGSAYTAAHAGAGRIAFVWALRRRAYCGTGRGRAVKAPRVRAGNWRMAPVYRGAPRRSDARALTAGR